MDPRLETAQADIRALRPRYPDLRVTGVPANQGQTNRVLFGTYDGAPVAIKHYTDPARRQQEAVALDRMAATGVVPEAMPVDDAHILVTRRIDGEALRLVYDGLNGDDREAIYEGVGAALAAIETGSARPSPDQAWERRCRPGQVDLHFFRHSAWPDFVAEIIDRCRHGMARHDLRDADLTGSLQVTADHQAAVGEHEIFFMGSDFGSNNTVVHEGRFARFVDLEMSRYGNAVFLVGTGLFMVWRQGPEHAAALIRGYRRVSERSDLPEFLRLCRIFAPFSYWVNFAWYFNMDSLPPWAEATDHRQKILNLITTTVQHARAAAEQANP